MSTDKVKEFPDVTQKLAAPKKLSAFEKERQAAEDKRRRAEEENAAALKAFQDSFLDEGDDDDDDPLSSAIGGRGRGRGPPSGPRGGRGYGGAPRSGPGSLGPGVAPPSLKRKRALDEMREAQEARREAGMLADEDPRYDRRSAPQDARPREEDEAPRPTVQLSQLPPSTTSDDVERLLGEHVKVHSVIFPPPAGPGMAGKRSLSAIASLAHETSTAQIDAAVTALKDRYLGCGFYLSISRHLSSAALHPSMAAVGSMSIEPFGAEIPPRETAARPSMRNAPPPSDHHHRGFAPPDSYDSPSRGSSYGMPAAQPEALVSTRPPLDISTLRAIHTLVERLLTEPSPQRALQIEALLMATPAVQQDERFAFLYDSRSPAGLYYRYLLWSPSDPTEAKRNAKGLERIYGDMAFSWAPPPPSAVPFPSLTSLADAVTDLDYVSSDEESDDEDPGPRNPEVLAGRGEEKNHLAPLKRARLVHLLSRLPASNARLRKGDVARITHFAISHAGAGAEEIVDLLLFNVERPFCFSLAAQYENCPDEAGNSSEEDEYEPEDELPALGISSAAGTGVRKEAEDPSTARLIALYLISDILSASSTAGARNAWKYRQLFETGFKYLHTFEKLGRLEKELGWGRLKAEQWKRRVGVLFSIWEGWSVFSGDVLEELRGNFLEPPLTEEEKAVEKARELQETRARDESKGVARFKVVETGGKGNVDAPPMEDLDGAPMEDLDGAPMSDDIDGAPMEDLGGAPMEDLDGAPMEDVDGTPMEDTPLAPPQPEAKSSEPAESNAASNTASKTPSGPKRRMRAEDMFASDED